MRTIFFIIAFFMFNQIFAHDVTTNNANSYDTELQSTNNTLLATINISVDDLTRPWVINVPAPSENITAIYGPCAANYATWTVSNGRLTISYARDNAYLDMYDGGTFYIYVITSSQTYEIKVVVSL